MGANCGSCAKVGHHAAENKHIEADATEQAACLAIQGLRKRGQSLRRITANLNNQGHRTRSGSEWRLESVVRVLHRESPSHAVA